MSQAIIVNLEEKDSRSMHSLGALSIAAYARSKGIEVKLVSSVKDIGKVVETVRSYAPSLCGFAVNYMTEPFIVSIIDAIKEELGIPIVVGGPQVTYTGEHSRIRSSKSDLFVRGDGEVAFASIVGNLARLEDIISGGLHIEGVSSNKFFSPEIATVDLRSMPSPYPLENPAPRLYWETSRGCAFNCIFCGHTGRRDYFREIPIERLRQEIDYFKSLVGLQALDVIDPLLGGTKHNTMRVLSLLKELEGVFITASLRGEYIDEQMADLLHDARIGFLDVGVQTFNPALAYFRRNGESVQENLRLLNERGVNYNIDLIAGIPEDDFESYRESIRKVVEDVRPTSLKIFKLKIYEGTPLQQLAETSGWRYDPDSKVILNTDTISGSELTHWMDFGNNVVGLYRYLTENNWFGQEAQYRSLIYFEKVFASLKEKSPQTARELSNMGQGQKDYNPALLEKVWKLAA
jgi:radical SAM superfamily enzyme YgiQ (UPF0313 family)